MKKRTISFTALFFVTLAMLGCGPNRPETATITGTVTYQGQPLDGARVSFYPERGRPANGTTDAQGQFTLMTFEAGDGAMLGQHQVTIAKQKMLAPPSPQNPLGTVQYFIPKRYADPTTSGFTAMVKRGKNDFTFDLVN